jgi:pimeloyl-ACP methyl ester carboxylesterase
MAAAQRPAALATLGEPSGPPAWKTTPSWYIVAGKDNAIGTKVERIMAKRIHAHTTDVNGASHVVLMSHPGKTTQVILDAARATG